MTNSLFKEVRTTFKIAKIEYIIKFFISILLRGLLLIIPILYSIAINNITIGNYNMALIYFIVSIFITALYRFLEAANQYYYYKLYNALSNHYTSLAISKTNDNSLYSLSRFNLGMYTNTTVTDVDVMCAFIGSLVYRVVQLLEFIIIFIYFYALNVYIFISALIISIIMLVLSLVSGKKIEKLNINRKDTLDRTTNSFNEYFLGIRDIKSFNLFNSISSTINKKASDYLAANAKYNVIYQGYNQIYLFGFEFFRLATMIYGVFLVKNSLLDIGVLLIIYNYYQKIIDNFSMILTMNVEYRNFNVSFNRFYKLLEFSKVRKNKDYIQNITVEGNIEFKDIIYGPKDNPLLNKVSFKIKSNSLTVITGKTNNGKSGVFELLLKLNRQHEGDITIDKYNINDFNDEDYYDMISAARKQTNMFKQSVLDNLGMHIYDKERIISVCEKLGISDYIKNLPNGYDTIINDNNVNDEIKQLLTIARVLVRNSKIMLFDDVITGLDESSEKRIVKIFNDLKKHHTIIVISHDKDLFKCADDIIVLDNHKVVEEGTIKELSTKKGVFYELYEEKIHNQK